MNSSTSVRRSCSAIPFTSGCGRGWTWQTAALRQKYGIQYRFIDIGNSLKRLVGRNPDTVAVVLTLT